MIKHKIEVNEINKDKFVALFRQIRTGIWRFTDIGIKGYENDYLREQDIVVELDDVDWGDEIIIDDNSEFVLIRHDDKNNSFNMY